MSSYKKNCRKRPKSNLESKRAIRWWCYVPGANFSKEKKNGWCGCGLSLRTYRKYTLGLCLSLSLSLPTYGNYYSKELHTFWHISSQKIVNKQNAVYVNNQYYFKHSVVQWHWFSKIKHSIRTFTRRHGFFFQSHRRFQTLVYMSLDVWSRKTDVSSVSPRNRMSNGRRITRIS